jgi:hypothetical protein
MKKLELKQMESLNGLNSCETATGFLCAATVILAFGPFAPLAAATGIGCGLGAYAGCAN